MAKTNYIHVELPGDMKKKMRTRCGQDDLKISEVIRELVTRWLAGNIVLDKPEPADIKGDVPRSVEALPPSRW
jgi:Arc/MetJ-type ribon-helix-helix transcriptional regulator